MDMASLERDLQRRITQSRKWLASDNLPLISGLKIRNYPCTAKPENFLHYPTRKERYGVRFRLEFFTSRTYEAIIDILIKPNHSESETPPWSLPYIISYVVNPETGAKKPITYDYLQNPVVYAKTLSQSIEEWYKDWLSKALAHKNVAKIFTYKKEKEW